MPLLLEWLMTAQHTHHTQAAPVQPSVAVRHHDCRKMAFMLQLQIKQSRLENVIELKIIWKTIGCFPSHDTGWRHDTGTVWYDAPSPPQLSTPTSHLCAANNRNELYFRYSVTK